MRLTGLLLTLGILGWPCSPSESCPSSAPLPLHPRDMSEVLNPGSVRAVWSRDGTLSDLSSIS